jgi:hypothetical protein
VDVTIDVSFTIYSSPPCAHHSTESPLCETTKETEPEHAPPGKRKGLQEEAAAKNKKTKTAAPPKKAKKPSHEQQPQQQWFPGFPGPYMATPGMFMPGFGMFPPVPPAPTKVEGDKQEGDGDNAEEKDGSNDVLAPTPNNSSNNNNNMMPMMMYPHHPAFMNPAFFMNPAVFQQRFRPPARAGTVLSMACDVEQLSDYQILVRQQLELFEAAPEDVESNTQGRKKPVTLNQVGLRCRHCAPFPLRARGRGAVYYPGTLYGIYQAAQNMAGSHLCGACLHISPQIQQELRRLREKRDNASGGKQYWADGCRALGLVQDQNCLRFKHAQDAEKEEDVASAELTTV